MNETLEKIKVMTKGKKFSVTEIESLVENDQNLYLINETINNGSDVTRIISYQGLKQLVHTFRSNGHKYTIWSKIEM